jgi:methyl-accepting chemotaxis protein
MYSWIRTLPIWARIVGAFIIVMVVATGGMIFWGVHQQRRIALQQAYAFATASTHMAHTALGLAMASADSKEIDAVVAQLQESQGIKALKIVPTETVKQQFKIGNAPQSDALEKGVLQDGNPHFDTEQHGGTLIYRAIMPLKASRNFIGRDCTSCHQVAEGTVLGVVSLEIGLDQLQQASADFQRATVIGAFGLGAILVLAFYYLCRRTIARPLYEVVSQLKDMSQGEGDLTRRLRVRNQDEIGELAKWFNEFVEKIQKTVRRIGDSVQSLASSAEELTAVSQQMAGISEETAAQANVVSAGSEQVSTSVQTVAAGAEEMSASIKEISKSANDAARVAKDAVEVTDKTNQTITQLGASSAEIGNVLKVITSIAEQTNLLALNATIEAARAGEAGKGFAVVANEVKELAKQTGQATEDISNKIGAIQHDTEGAVAAIAQIGGVITQINGIASTIASAVEEQTVTTNEMARNVAEAAKGSNEIVQNISGVAEAAQSAASGATETQTAAQELARLASELQAVVGQFKYEGEGQQTQSITAKKESGSKREAGSNVLRKPAGVTLHTL